MGTTSSSNHKELTRVLLPFAIDLHCNLQGDLNLAQNHLITKLFSSTGLSNTSALSSSIKECNKLKVSTLVSGFIATHKKPEPIVRYYAHLLEKLIRWNQGGEPADWTSQKRLLKRHQAKKLKTDTTTSSYVEDSEET